jgi:hypothetical protein
VSLAGLINDRVSFHDLHPKPLSNGKGKCALHENKSSYAFNYDDIRGIWYCHYAGCKVGGNKIHFFGHLNGLDSSTKEGYVSAFLRMAEAFNIPHGDINQEELRMKAKKSEMIRKMFKDFANRCHEALKDSEHYERVKESRGFTDDTMTRFKIGLITEEVKHWMETQYGREELVDGGLMKIYSKRVGGEMEPPFPHWTVGKRVVFPYFDFNETPIYFIYRRIDDEQDHEFQITYRDGNVPKYYKQKSTEYVRNELFGLNTIRGNLDTLIITEGIADAISVIQAGFPCISPVTTSFSNKDVEMALWRSKGFRKVVVINDNEENESGRKGAEKILKEFIPNGVNVSIGIIPRTPEVEKIDLDDYLRQGDTIEEQEALLQQLVDNSIEGLEYFLNNIDNDSTQNDIIEFLRILPLDDIKVFRDVQDEIAGKTNLTKRDIEGYFKEILRENYQREEEKNTLQERSREEVTEEVKNAVESFLQSENKLEYVERALNYTIIGERENKLLTYALMAGERAGFTEIVLIVGDSTSGKTLLVNKIMELFPRREVCYLTGLSDKAMLYREWKDHYLVINEIQRNLNVIEQLKDMGDDGIIYIVVLKDKNGKLKTQEIKIGLMSVVGTTTKVNLNSEFLNRAWILETDLTKEQTDNITNYTVATVRSVKDSLQRQKEYGQMRKVIREALTVIKVEYDFTAVEIPYADKVQRIFKSTFLKLRRDHKKFFKLIKIITALNYKIRDWYEYEGHKILLSHPKDLETAMDIGNDIFINMSQNLTPEMIKVIECLNDFTQREYLRAEELEADLTTVKTNFKTSEIHREFCRREDYRKSYRSFRNLLNSLETYGWFSKQKEGNSNTYKLERNPSFELVTFEDLEEECMGEYDRKIAELEDDELSTLHRR